MIYSASGLPDAIRDDPPGSCTYPTTGLPQDFCYQVNEPATVDILPWEPTGMYRVEVVQGAASFTRDFEVHPVSEPAIVYSGRAKGYVLAGFKPNEHVKIVQYDGIDPVGAASMQLDEHGAGLLISSRLGVTATLAAVRDDLSTVEAAKGLLA